MTFRQLMKVMQDFATQNPDSDALDRQVVVRVGVASGEDDEDVYVGGLQSAVVDAGHTEDLALTLDGDDLQEED